MEARAILRNNPISPRKMRRVANLIRGLRIGRALTQLKFVSSPNAKQVEKLLLSAVANWQAKHIEAKIAETDLYVKEVWVDAAPMIKRYRPAPHGRAHRIRKRANHFTLCVGVTREAAEKAEAIPEEAPSPPEATVSTAKKE